ncbi:MAG: anaerobic dimethyl sulfoxide reductase, subunit, DmsA/YnfE family [Firmicutes bacterium]|nr:anaerobic dimethyl sulfoxide reductase, subunit, DmsA/YnfE family [Bacillota bacterium]
MFTNEANKSEQESGSQRRAFSRRSFIKWSAAASSSLALVGCGSAGFKQASSNVNVDEADEKVISTGGTNNCGGCCVIKAHVKDGVVVRLSTDDQPDEPNNPQIRACVRGRSYRKTWFHPDRLKYPMKRVGKRGEGKFERITWDEATTIIAKEMKRIREKYGAEARYANYAWGISAQIAGLTLAKRLLASDGGYLGFYQNYSNACTNNATPYTYGTNDTGNNYEDWVNAKLIVLWGFNPAEVVFGGQTMYWLRRAKDAGAKIIVVDPRYTDTAVALADQWIPLLPTTDNALMDAMTYVMITENLLDKAYLDTYCLGFDEEHMPAGVPANQSLKSYILGQSDGVPKTPEWAEKICRVPSETIRQFARDYAMTKPAALIQGWGPQRNAMGEQVARGGTVLASITGNVGISGGWASGIGYSPAHDVASLGAGENPIKAQIPVFMWTDAVTRGTEMTKENDGLRGVDKLNTNIKMILNIAGNCLVNQHADINKTVKILEDEKSVEFIVVSDVFMTPSAKFADILLPGNTVFERDNINVQWAFGDYAVFNNKLVDPPFECRDEYDWMTEVADKLGIKEKFTEGRTREQWLHWIVAETQKANPGFPSYDEFKKMGIYKFKIDKPIIRFEKQIKDPANNPFPTPSGKIEIFSKRLWDMNNAKEIPAIPKHVVAHEGPQDQLKEKYPLQCIGWHFKARCHSIHDNNPWLKEAAPQEMWMNPKDAEARSIKKGDRVKVFNDRGATMIPVKVTTRIVPGVVAIPQGAWYTPDEKGVDQHGCINVLTTQRPTPLAKANAQHTNLVEIQKA